tara:strand:+ start:2320 stop:2694 length:375 start_codon:yes stop_codon:yes gene_type:complete
MSINLSFKDKVKDSSDVNVDELISFVNEKVEKKTNELNFSNLDSFMALEMDYTENYLKTDLVHICNYYGISTRKKRKDELANLITLFESEQSNMGFVMRRKYLWNCMEELTTDPYLKKFLIPMN